MGLRLRIQSTDTNPVGNAISIKGSILDWPEADSNFVYLLTNMSGSNVKITGSTGIMGNVTITGGLTVRGLSPAASNSILTYDSSSKQVFYSSPSTIFSPLTGSFLTTASATNNVITFTKGNGSTFNVTINTGSAVTTPTSSLLVTASVSSNIITFTKGDGSTFPITVATGSAVTTPTASLLVTASATNNVITFTKGDNSQFNVTIATGSGGGGSTTPGGLNTQIQFNSASVFSGSSQLTYDYTNSNLRLTGSLYLSGSTQSGGNGNVLTYNTTTGLVTYTSSAAIGGGGGGGGGSSLTTKAGAVANTSFAGSPLTAAVTFSTASANTNYAVVVTGVDARSWTVQSKLTTGFTINSNSNTPLTGDTYWVATAYGEN